MIYSGQSMQIEKESTIQGLTDLQWHWLSKQDQIKTSNYDYKMYHNPP
jgi:hypothetical protein